MEFSVVERCLLKVKLRGVTSWPAFSAENSRIPRLAGDSVSSSLHCESQNVSIASHYVICIRQNCRIICYKFTDIYCTYIAHIISIYYNYKIHLKQPMNELVKQSVMLARTLNLPLFQQKFLCADGAQYVRRPRVAVGRRRGFRSAFYDAALYRLVPPANTIIILNLTSFITESEN